MGKLSKAVGAWKEADRADTRAKGTLPKHEARERLAKCFERVAREVMTGESTWDEDDIVAYDWLDSLT
ncbi:MAG: hypothetical protein WC538_20960 [Thermoanaerobaculia bacterium]|jgi:hypothetical protein